MPNRILALDLQAAHLVAVTVETSFRGYKFVGHYSEPRDAARPLAEQLRSFIGAHAITADTVLTALPGNAAAYRILDLPFRDRRKLGQTVPFELESQVPFALEEAIVDFLVLSKTAEGARVFAAMVPRQRIEEHLKALADAGLDPAVVDFAPLSTLNVLQLFDGDRPNRYAFVHVSSGQGTVALYNDGCLEGLRVLDVGAGAESAELAREVCWSLRSFNGRAAPAPGAAGSALPLLVGGSPPGLEEMLERESAFTVQRLEDLPLRDVPESLRQRQALYAPALGLALREIADAPTLGLNFRRDDFAYQRGLQEMRGGLVRLGVLAAVVLLLFMVSAWISVHQLSTEYAEAREAVRTVFHATLPDKKPVDETAQLGQAIEELRKRQQQLGVPAGGGVSALELLRDVSTRAPAEPRMNVEELTLDTEALRLRGKTSSFEAVEAVKRSLSESPLYKEVQVKDPRTTPDGAVEFRLNLLFGKSIEE